MSGVILFDIDEICDNCGGRGAFDFMGDCFCPGCLKMCKSCGDLFVIDLSKTRTEQEQCSECGK